MWSIFARWWEQRRPAPRTARLYTRGGCCLCDVARGTLETGGYRVETIDIDADPALRARFDTEIPVVEIDGKIRFRGTVDPILLARLSRECDTAPSNAS